MYIGRKKELSALREGFESQGASISVVYGRRRIGKTSLIHEAARGFVFYTFEGLETGSTAEQKEAFLYQLREYYCKVPESVNAKSPWFEILGLLPQLLSQTENTVILLDEFQWLANYRQEIVSHLKLIWDQKLSKNPEGPSTKIVLCGSIASFIVKKVLKSKALYGRIDLAIHLSELLLEEVREFFPERSREEVVIAYLLVGGVPKYLTLLQDRSSVLQSFQFHVFRKLSYFVTEYSKIFISHFSKNDNYEKLTRFLSQRGYGSSRKEISEKLSIPNSGELTRLLDNLEYAGFISSFVPFDRKQTSNLKRYFLTDFYLRFYLKILEPLMDQEDFEKIDFVRDLFSSSRFRAFLGESFELLAYSHRHQIAKILGFGKVRYQSGPYFRHSKRGAVKGVQLDLVFKRADLVYTVCEVKYSDKPVSLAEGRKFAEQISLIEEFEKYTIEKILIAKNTASKELVHAGYFSHIIEARELLGS